MKVNSNRDISFKGFINSKPFKKGLEFAGKNPAFFAASTTLSLSMFARPIAITLAPNADKENKKIACAKSIASSAIQFVLTYALSVPIVNALEKIEENPKKYIKPETIKTFKKGSERLVASKKYLFATQMLKLSVGLAVAIPKGVLTAKFIPTVLDKVFHHKKSYGTGDDIKELKQQKYKEEHADNYYHKDFEDKNLSFKSKRNEKFAKTIGKFLDKKVLQNFSEKHKDSNFVMHMVAGTDVLTTVTFVNEIYKSDDIREKRKKALIYNAGLSTGFSIFASYLLDRCLDKPTEKFIERYKTINLKDPNLEKQIKGIKIAKPILLVACVYYTLIPFISTILAEKADRNPKLDLPHHKPKRNKI